MWCRQTCMPSLRSSRSPSAAASSRARKRASRLSSFPHSLLLSTRVRTDGHSAASTDRQSIAADHLAPITQAQTHARTHTHTHSLSLSLSPAPPSEWTRVPTTCRLLKRQSCELLYLNALAKADELIKCQTGSMEAIAVEERKVLIATLFLLSNSVREEAERERGREGEREREREGEGEDFRCQRISQSVGADILHQSLQPTPLFILQGLMITCLPASLAQEPISGAAQALLVDQGTDLTSESGRESREKLSRRLSWRQKESQLNVQECCYLTCQARAETSPESFAHCILLLIRI